MRKEPRPFKPQPIIGHNIRMENKPIYVCVCRHCGKADISFNIIGKSFCINCKKENELPTFGTRYNWDGSFTELSFNDCLQLELIK